MARDLILPDLRIPVEKDTPAQYRKAAARVLELSEVEIEVVKILFKSLITATRSHFFYEVSLVVRVPDTYENKDGYQPYIERPFPVAKKAPAVQRPMIIGFGPAGMFAALELIECGQAPLIFERGKPIEQRHRDIRRFIRERILDTESNIQFGEGGAGLYSDGKLFSSKNNSIYATKTLDTFVRFGAPAEIRYLHKPHIGTDMLCKIVANIRDYIISHGGEIRYESKMTDITIQDKAATGVVINGSTRYPSSCIFLALGNSARDTFEMLHAKGVVLESKPISVGVRIEHPAKTIDRMQYGNKYDGYPGLGAANYYFNYVNKFTRRAAYTFCMCPGGEVVNASSEKDMLVINGMSYAARNSAFSNSAIVVGCTPKDYKSNHPLAGVEFQRAIEAKAFLASNKTWKAPAQNLTDFLRRKPSAKLCPNSFKMGVHPAILDSIFPGFVNETLRQAFSAWKSEHPLFIYDEALLMAAETRTSAPVRIKRKKTFQSVNIANLYPIGEGSGYSGGINSAAIDAIRAVESVMGNSANE